MTIVAAPLRRLSLPAACLLVPFSATAGSFSVPPAAGPQSVSGSDTGTIEAGSTLAGGGSPAITWSAPATTTPGVVVSNSGTVTSDGRAIDTASDVSGAFTLTNGGIIASTNDAFRINGTLADGKLTLVNSGTIESQDGQALDFDKATAASSSVVITNSGTIRSATADAIRLGGGTIAITNSGTIQADGDGKRAIKFDTASNFDTLVSFSLRNGEKGVITASDDAIKVSSPAGSTAAPAFSITNSGIIRSTGAGQAIDLGDVSSPNAVFTISNDYGAAITAADNDAIMAAGTTRIENYGAIRSSYSAGTADTQNNSAIKIDGGATGATLVVENDGSISGAYHGIKADSAHDMVEVSNYDYGTISGSNGSGVNSNGDGNIYNLGGISGRADPAASFGDGDGIDIDGYATVVNAGFIEGRGSHGIKPGETKPSTSEGLAIGGGIVLNDALDDFFYPGFISGANNGILADDSNGGDALYSLFIRNSGTIIGLDGYGVRYVNSGADPSKSLTIINFGLISGTEYAVLMGGGNDRFDVGDGSSVEGIVDAEGGRDTLVLRDDLFDLAEIGTVYRHFEELAVRFDDAGLTGSTDFAGPMLITQYGGATLYGAALPNVAVTVVGTNVCGISVECGPGEEAWVESYIAGRGTIGALSVDAHSFVAPGTYGTPVGTLVIKGDLKLDGTYFVDVSLAGEADLLAVGGTAELGPDARVVAALADPDLEVGARYLILSAAGGVSGTFAFAGPPEAYLFLDVGLVYEPQSVYLALDRNGVAFADYAATANAAAAAHALDRAGATAQGRRSDLYSAFVSQVTGDRPTLALAELSGDIQATLPGQITGENMLVNDLILGRLRQAGYAGAPGAQAALGAGGPALAYADPAPAGSGAFKGLKAPAAAPMWTGWAQGYGQWLAPSSSGNAAAADTHAGGILIGADVAFTHYVLGLAAGYSSASTSADGASANTETWRLAAYGGASFDALKLRAGATYGWSSIDSSRFVALTGEAPKANYDGTAGNLFAEAGYTFAFGAVALEPFAGIGWTKVDLGSFIEANAPVAGLASAGAAFDTAYSTLGVRFATSFAAGDVTVTPHASAGWRHAFGDVTPEAVLTFVSAGTSFGIDGLPIAEDSLVGTAGLDFVFAGGATFSLAYEGMAGDGVSSNAGKATLSMRF